MLCTLIKRSVASHARVTHLPTNKFSHKVQCWPVASLSSFNTAKPTCSAVTLIQQNNSKCTIRATFFHTICDINSYSRCLTKPIVPVCQQTQYSSFITTSVKYLDIKNGESTKPTLWVRFKTMAKDYWYVFLPVHFVTSCAWFGGFYLVVYSGVDVVQILENIGASDSIVNALKRYEHTGNFAVAFFIYELAKPIRYAATVGATTATINILSARGIIKPFPKKDKLQTMYEDGKDEVKRQFRTRRRKINVMYKNLKNGKRKNGNK